MCHVKEEGWYGTASSQTSIPSDLCYGGGKYLCYGGGKVSSFLLHSNVEEESLPAMEEEFLLHSTGACACFCSVCQVRLAYLAHREGGFGRVNSRNLY
jgi:hypothetical protein